jgi:hypothetical protein
MTDMATVSEVVHRASAPFLSKVGLRRVSSEPAIGSEGQDILRVLIVLEGDGPVDIDGNDVVDLMVAARRQLYEAGEERQPIFEFATENELRDVADSEA